MIKDFILPKRHKAIVKNAHHNLTLKKKVQLVTVLVFVLKIITQNVMKVVIRSVPRVHLIPAQINSLVQQIVHFVDAKMDIGNLLTAKNV